VNEKKGRGRKPRASHPLLFLLRGGRKKKKGSNILLKAAEALEKKETNPKLVATISADGFT